jgi:hypothetical protein
MAVDLPGKEMKTIRRADGDDMFGEYSWWIYADGDDDVMHEDAKGMEVASEYVIETWRLVKTEVRLVEPAAEDRT